MINGGSMKLLAAAVATFCILLAGSRSQAQESLDAERPVSVPGDVFEYAERYQSVACKRWEVTAVDRSGATTTRCGDNTAYYAPDHALLRIVGGDGEDLVRFTPQSPAIPFPLHLGAKWAQTFQLATAGSLFTPTIDETCQAMAVETVVVKAGTLTAFRIACTDAWSVGILSGTSSTTLWYAPAARTVVKQVSSGSDEWNFELTSYSLNDIGR